MRLFLSLLNSEFRALFINSFRRLIIVLSNRKRIVGILYFIFFDSPFTLVAVSNGFSKVVWVFVSQLSAANKICGNLA